MKNTLRLFGILAVTAMIGFTMTACGGGGNGNDAPPPPPPPGTNGGNGAVPDPDNPAWAHTFEPPFVTTGDILRSPLVNAIAGDLVGTVGAFAAADGNVTALFGTIYGALPGSTNPPAQPADFRRARWVSAPSGSPSGSMTMHVFGRTHDFDGIWINLDELNYALQGIPAGTAPAPTPAPLGAWTMPLLGQGNATQLVPGDRLVITGRVDTVSAYGNRNVELVRDALPANIGNAATFLDVNRQLLAETLISSDPRAGATGEEFELVWDVSYADPAADNPAFGTIGLITRGWAGNNLHASGIADIFIDSIAIQRASARALAIGVNDITRVTEGVLVRAGRSMDGHNTPRPGIEVLIMPQRYGMGELHRGITFAFGSDSGAGPGNHLQVGDWSRFGWVSIVIPEYANHEIDNHEIAQTRGRDNWCRSNISLLLAHGWDYGSEGNRIGGSTTAAEFARIPGWVYAAPPGGSSRDIELTDSDDTGHLDLEFGHGIIRDIHGFRWPVDAEGRRTAATAPVARVDTDFGPALPALFHMSDWLAVPQGLRQQGRVLSIPMEYIHNENRVPARGGRGGISIFSGDTAIDDDVDEVDGRASQNFSLIISHIVFHDGPFHTRFLGNINF